MEQRFFMNDFEHSLKEHADKFQMVPSKKVWHGIYNDLHPGKRWPSVTMSLLLIFTLVVIGHLNTNNSRRSAYVANKISEVKTTASNLKRTRNSRNSQRIVVRKTDLDKNREIFVYSTGQPGNKGSLTTTTVNNDENNNSKTGHQIANNLIPPNNLIPWSYPGSSAFEQKFVFSPKPGSDLAEDNLAENAYNKETLLQNSIDINGTMNETLQSKTGENNIDNSQLQGKISIDTKNTSTGEKPSSLDKNVSSDKNITNNIPANKKPAAVIKTSRLHKKRNDKISWVYFAAPVVSSVSFSGKPLKSIQGVNLITGSPANQKDGKVLHSSALGFEAGAQMNYTLTKKLQFTIGAHLTYSGYNIISNEVHPIPAILELRDPATGTVYSRSYETHYGDGTGQSIVTLRNYNLQASIPIGLHYEFLGNEKVQFNVGGDLEPSLVLKSNAYILSSEGNTYVNDPSLLRKLNMNSNFGAFVTFRSTKFKWQIGPNFRYQLLSTYRKDYTLKEHLIDYGIRIGISR
ncbi:MAG: hypothetical protein ABI863_22725 [Ginsengibacter sp.]